MLHHWQSACRRHRCAGCQHANEESRAKRFATDAFGGSEGSRSVAASRPAPVPGHWRRRVLFLYLEVNSRTCPIIRAAGAALPFFSIISFIGSTLLRPISSTPPPPLVCVRTSWHEGVIRIPVGAFPPCLPASSKTVVRRVCPARATTGGCPYGFARPCVAQMSIAQESAQTPATRKGKMSLTQRVPLVHC